MKRTLFFVLIIFCFIIANKINGQNLIKNTFKESQPFDVMKGNTSDIVQILPGEKIIYKTTINNKTIMFYTDKGGKNNKIYEGNQVGNLSYSRTGEQICFKAGNEFIVKELNTNLELRFQTVEQMYLNGFANISPEGNEITFNKSKRLSKKGETINDDIIVVKNLTTKEDKIIGNGAWPKWSPISAQIVFSKVEGTRGNWISYLWLVNSDGSVARKLNSSANLNGARVEWSPDGKYVMDSDRKGDLRIVDIEKDKAVIIPPKRFGTMSNARKEYIQKSWSPDGKTILAEIIIIKNITDEDLGREMYLISVDGINVEKIDVPSMNTQFPVWLNNSELLVRDSKQGNIWIKAIVRSAER